MKWLDALKIFNRDHKGTWCIPKKDTPEYKTVVDIMNGKHMRRQEIQGSGIVDFFGEAYIKNKAKKEKDVAEKLARTRSLQEHYRVRKAAEKAAAAAPVVTSTPVVGSGFMNDYLRKVSKRLDEREKVEKIKTAERNKTYPTLATGGGRRGRPKGSKNKVKKGGNIFGDFKNSLASVGKTMDAINPIKQSHKALLKAIK